MMSRIDYSFDGSGSTRVVTFCHIAAHISQLKTRASPHIWMHSNDFLRAERWHWYHRRLLHACCTPMLFRTGSESLTLLKSDYKAVAPESLRLVRCHRIQLELVFFSRIRCCVRLLYTVSSTRFDRDISLLNPEKLAHEWSQEHSKNCASHRRILRDALPENTCS